MGLPREIIYSFEAVCHFNVCTGISLGSKWGIFPLFSRDPFPDDLLRVMSEREATNLRDTFDRIFDETRAKKRYTVFPSLLCLTIIGITNYLFWTCDNNSNFITPYLCAMFIPFGICFIFVIWYLATRKPKRKNSFDSFIEAWNENNDNVEKGLSMGLSDHFWDGVYPQLGGTKYSFARDIEICQNLPNIYIHLYQVSTGYGKDEERNKVNEIREQSKEKEVIDKIGQLTQNEVMDKRVQPNQTEFIDKGMKRDYSNQKLLRYY